MLEQFADHGRDGVGGGRGTDGLQVAAGGERAAFALDHEHTDIVRRLDLRAELFELFGDRKVDRVERGRPVEGDGGDRAFDPQQRRIVGKGGTSVIGCRHGEWPGVGSGAGI